ncbi:glycosyltransferase [Clostridium sp.]|uniref:glycosyltransferase n=1 Tax=Clostridium sp. TaxID=1506 RepID=UPI003F3491B9
MIVKYIMLGAFIIFTFIMIYYSKLAIKGLYYKINYKEISIQKENLPTIDVFIPSHNEGVVVKDTLDSMSKLRYDGKLNIYLLNDNSQDETGDIADEFASVYKNIHHIKVPQGEPKGKSRVLNYGLSISSGEYFVVYDGDNQPEPTAIQYLMNGVLKTKGAVGAVGTVKTINAKSNLLTRMIAIEFQVFQLILQAGRWKNKQIGSLPGTNMMLKRSLIEELGGYDEYALAEDAELTIRITAMGGLIVVEPRSITWEQEPETIKALLRQRTRWLQGNLYLAFKFFKTPNWWTRRCYDHFMHYLIVYLVFPGLLLVCNTVFILGLLGIINIDFKIPFLLVWFLSYYVYTIQIIFAQWYDNTLTLKNMLVGSIMYFTYAQLFIVIFLKGIVATIKMRRNGNFYWDKTERVAVKK